MSLEMESNIKELCELLKNDKENVRGIELIKHTENISDVTLHFNIESNPIKITTDFKKYCYAESILDTLNLNKFNLNIIFTSKNPRKILNEINKVCNINLDQNKKINLLYIYAKSIA